ncbi:uncharacterized protein MKK02DRAFT_29303 [Dioszegia hungarica]|uniref:Uncharacterized protein n=1 Tax=Dioszegia hungarica TaxID=4972 RepID=A0AA38LYP3_9TREE|nr:uncharacterized protein MKK02DRAFT_29303 [Dioszegia hungarica]KAI9639194.1 hypothetical protein MKK02DRAFT_29303 [Dioszegia hungarica]
MASTGNNAQAGFTNQLLCASDPGTPHVPQSSAMEGTTRNMTFDGSPPYRLLASATRGGRVICTTHMQNLTSNTFTWVVSVTTNQTSLNLTSGDLSTGPNRGMDPVFQLGDGVQFIAHEWARQLAGNVRFYKSTNYTVENEQSRKEQREKLESRGLKVAGTGVVGWLVGALLLSSVAAMGLQDCASRIVSLVELLSAEEKTTILLLPYLVASYARTDLRSPSSSWLPERLSEPDSTAPSADLVKLS